MKSLDPQLTVIIPSWNGKQLLRHCLESLRLQTRPAAVLVVDNGSGDGTEEMLGREFPEVRCFRFPANQGFARAVNQGIRLTDTPFLALLNNDTEADPRWVEAGLRAFQQHREFSFFACRMVNFRHRECLDSAGDCYDRRGMPYKRGWGRPVQDYDRPEPVLGASAGAAFYRRDLFQRVGLFDEDFHTYLEDVEFSLRCQLAGHRCLYLPEAVVYHLEAASDPERADLESPGPEPGDPPRVFYSGNRVFWISRNRWLLMCLYQPWRNLPFLAYGWAHSALFHLLRAGFFGAFVRGLFAAWLRSPQALRKRAQLLRDRRISTAELCRLLREC